MATLPFLKKAGFPVWHSVEFHNQWQNSVILTMIPPKSPAVSIKDSQRSCSNMTEVLPVCFHSLWPQDKVSVLPCTAEQLHRKLHGPSPTLHVAFHFRYNVKRMKVQNSIPMHFRAPHRAQHRTLQILTVSKAVAQFVLKGKKSEQNANYTHLN